MNRNVSEAATSAGRIAENIAAVATATDSTTRAMGDAQVAIDEVAPSRPDPAKGAELLAPRLRAGHSGAMRTRTRSGLRRALPWIGGGLATQAALAVAGLLWARWKDEGDDSTAGIRRVRVIGGVQLRPRNPELSRIRLDVVMGGGDIDLGGLAPVAGGVDVTVHAVMGGAAVRVPAGWRVWSGLRAVAGGVGLHPGVAAAPDERNADLRLHGWAVMGGIGVEPAT